MKSRYFIISTIAAAFILNGNNTFAQNTNYLNCKVTHKAGMWYDSDYNHPRTPGTTNPDSFDDSEGMKVHPFNNDIRIQKVTKALIRYISLLERVKRLPYRQHANLTTLQ